MSEYQYLNAEIRVPKEWPVEIGRKLFINLIENAIIRHRSGQQVIVTVENVSAVITNYKNKPGYLLEKIEEINDENVYRIDLIFPAKLVILSLNNDGLHRGEIESVQCLPMILRSDHFISHMLLLDSEFHKVMTVVPNIEKILELKGITGPERYNYGFQTTYTIQKIKCLDDSVHEIEPIPSMSAGPSTFQKQVTNDKWDIVTFDRLEPPKRFQCTEKAARSWICYSVILVLVALMIYLCAILSLKL